MSFPHHRRVRADGAWTQASFDAKRLSGAFQTLRVQPFGWVPFGIVTVGHFAFGLIQARYRRIEAPDLDKADDAVARAVRLEPNRLALTSDKAAPIPPAASKARCSSVLSRRR